jgi:hypothetical protein
MAREAIAAQDDQQGGTYRLELVSCGKPACTRCAEGPAHGPYWYRYYRRGKKVVSKYVGKTLPAADVAFLEQHGDVGADTARMLAQGPAEAEVRDHAGSAPAVGVEDRIRSAYRALAGQSESFVTLAELRGHLAGMPRAEVDAALIGMYLDQDINLVPSTNQNPRVLTAAVRAAAVQCGGEDKHLVCVLARQG